MCEASVPKMIYVFSRSELYRPRCHMDGHPLIRRFRRFVPSYEHPEAPPPNMRDLLQMHYARVWRAELQCYLKAREQVKPKPVKPDLNYNRDRWAKMREKQVQLEQKHGLPARVPHKHLKRDGTELDSGQNGGQKRKARKARGTVGPHAH